MSALHDAANALQSLPLPYPALHAIEQDIDAARQLAAEVISGSTRAQALLGEFERVTRDGTQNATAGLNRLAQTLQQAAREIRDGARSPAPTGAGAPRAADAARVTRAAQLQDRARDRHTDKDIETGLRSVEALGYGVERRRNNHFTIHCPCGHCAPVIISSTPRRNDVALALLRQTAARGCHTRKTTP